jgi:hypothetical protein
MITAILALFLLSPSETYLSELAKTHDHHAAMMADYYRENGGRIP